jgi:predicted nucleic acid-binding protein
VAERLARGLLDTNVVIDLDQVPASSLPVLSAVSAITLAELAAGTHAASDPLERSRRQERLQLIEATLEVIPFDDHAARAYGRVFAAVSSAGRKARRRRAVDLLIAATACANDLALFTSDPKDFAGLGDLVEIRAV